MPQKLRNMEFSGTLAAALRRREVVNSVAQLLVR
jgi:hypothetical protein